MRAMQWTILPTALVLLSALVHAQDDEEETMLSDDETDMDQDPLTPEQLRVLHEKIDRNGNGKVSKKEMMVIAYEVNKGRASKGLGDILNELDKDQDGKLSLSEHLDDVRDMRLDDAEEVKESEAREEAETKKHAAADTNGDGLLDSTEVAALFSPETHEEVLSIHVEEAMRQKDKSKDGKLTNVEFWESQVDGDGEQELSEEEKDDFKTLDQDKDGFLDLEEMREWESGRFHTRSALNTIFDLADKDKDDMLTADELAGAAYLIGTSDVRHHLSDWHVHADEL